MVAGNEECDDGNNNDDDGCSSACSIELGWECSVVNCVESVCTEPCGNGFRTSGEECDDGNFVGLDGCSSKCIVECAFSCSGGGSGSSEMDQCTVIGCGDKAVGGIEQCDDGNFVNGDGCSSDCIIEPGYTCTNYLHPEYPCGAYSSWCVEVCGDGLVVGKEMSVAANCDDGNSDSGDGCASTCKVECGFDCVTAEPSVCESTCGDGFASAPGSTLMPRKCARERFNASQVRPGAL
jgi:large repetitive protein